MDAPKRTPLSERIRPQTAGKPDDLFDISRLYLETLANDIAALERHLSAKQEIIDEAVIEWLGKGQDLE